MNILPTPFPMRTQYPVEDEHLVVNSKVRMVLKVELFSMMHAFIRFLTQLFVKFNLLAEGLMTKAAYI